MRRADGEIEAGQVAFEVVAEAREDEPARQAAFLDAPRQVGAEGAVAEQDEPDIPAFAKLVGGVDEYIETLLGTEPADSTEDDRGRHGKERFEILPCFGAGPVIGRGVQRVADDDAPGDGHTGAADAIGRRRRDADDRIDGSHGEGVEPFVDADLPRRAGPAVGDGDDRDADPAGGVPAD